MSALRKTQSTRAGLMILAAILAAVALFLPAAARADFGFLPGSTSVTALDPDGIVDTQAAAHPGSYTVSFELNAGPDGNGEGGDMRDLIVDLPPGFFGNPAVVPTCSLERFGEGDAPACPPETQVGVVTAYVPGLGGQVKGPIYNLTPPHGFAAEFGFSAGGLTALQYASVRSDEGYGVRVTAPDIPLGVTRVTQTIWGVPADPEHDPQRGQEGAEGTGIRKPSSAPVLPFLTLPASCQSPPKSTLKADSVLARGVFAEESAFALDIGGNPAPMSGCEAVPFSPQISAAPTSKLTQNPSGLDFELTLPNQGLLDPESVAETQPRKTVVTLPEGVTVNPSFAEGIGACSPASTPPRRSDRVPGSAVPKLRRSAASSPGPRCSTKRSKAPSIWPPPTTTPSAP